MPGKKNAIKTSLISNYCTVSDADFTAEYRIFTVV